MKKKMCKKSNTFLTPYSYKEELYTLFTLSTQL